MSEVVIVSASAQTALGDLDNTWQGLINNRSGLEKNVLPGSLGRWPVGLVPVINGPLGSATRLSSLTRKLLAGIHEIPGDSDLVVSTTKGAPDELFNDGEEWSGQPWEMAHEIAEISGIKGDISTVSAACASGTIAVIQAAQKIKHSSRVKNCLVVGLDLVSVFVNSGFAKLHALSKDPSCPFDKNRTGLSLGEGGGAILLSDEDEALARSWPVLARVSGWGVSCDAGHITAPCREASGLIRAIQTAMNGRGLPGAVNAHGTGTSYNDAMEMVAFRELWQNKVPFHSVKGGIGHCLGAAGVIEAAVAVRSLQAGKIPPTVGLTYPEAGAEDICGDRVQELLNPSILSTNSGFGGINAALLLTEA